MFDEVLKWVIFYEIISEVKILTHGKFNRLPNNGIEGKEARQIMLASHTCDNLTATKHIIKFRFGLPISGVQVVEGHILDPFSNKVSGQRNIRGTRIHRL